jgi:hypothetical protein
MSAVALESPPANGRDHLSAAILKQRSVFTTNLLSTETLAPLALLSLRRRKQSRGGSWAAEGTEVKLYHLLQEFCAVLMA